MDGMLSGAANYGREYASELNKVQREFDEGDRNLLEYILGTGAYGIGKPIADAVGIPIGMAIEQIPDSVKQRAVDLAKQAGIPQALQAAGETIDQYVPERLQRAGAEAGMLASAMPAARALGINRDPATKGMFLSSGEVYKKGNYRPDDVELDPAAEILGGSIKAMIPLKTLDAAVDVKGVTPSQIIDRIEGTYKKGMGTLEWGAKGVGRVANLMFNPSARALYTERGIAPVFDTYYKMYQKAQEAGDTTAANNAIKLAHSQMQQMANIKKQAGQVTRGDDATKDFINAAADPDSPGAFFNAGEMGKGWFKQSTQNSKAVRTEQFGALPDADADFIEEYLFSKNAWDLKDPDKVNVIVKTPRSDVTGNHFKDILGRAPNVSNIAEVFADKDGNFVPFQSSDQLRQALIDKRTKLRTYQNKAGKNKPGDVKRDPKTGKPIPPAFSVVKTADDGVWVNFGRVGEAKVEGGVNALVKVGLDGTLTGVMSDLHNFYEKFKIPKTKITVQNRPMQMALPQEVLAITPPMRTTVQEIGRGSTFKASERAGIRPQSETIPIPEAATLDAARRRVEAAAEIRPSAGEVARQTVPVAQNVGLLGLGTASAVEQEQLPGLFGP